MHYTEQDFTPPHAIRTLTPDAHAQRTAEAENDARAPRKKRGLARLAWLCAFAFACTLLALPHNALAQITTGTYSSGASPAPVFRNTTPRAVTAYEDDVFVMRLADYVYAPSGNSANITFELVRSTYHDQFSNVATGWWGDSDKFEVLNAARGNHPRGAILFKTAPDYENPTDRRLQFREYRPPRSFWLPHGREEGPLRLRSWDRDNQYWLSVRATITDAQGRKHSSHLSIPVTVRKNDKVPPVFTNSAPTAAWVTENHQRVTEIITGRHITDPADPAGHSPRTITFAINQTWGDGNKFNIGSGYTPGTIIFRTAPDYENPTDVRITELRSGTTHLVSSARNNLYWLEITASVTDRDGGVHTAKHRMGVFVDNEWDTPPQKPLNLRQTGVGSGAGEAGRTVTLAWDQTISANRDDAPWRYEVNVFSWFPYRKVYTTHINIPNPQTFWRILSTRAFSHQVVLPNNGIFHVSVKPQNRVDGTPADKTLVVTNGVNAHAPAFSATTSFSNPENSTPSFNPSATDADPEDEVVSYALNTTFGDAALFQITSTGALSFRQAPNYENPLSAAGNNVYVVKVRATSRVPDTYQTLPLLFKPTTNRTRTTEAMMTITVTDVAERPGTPAAPTVAVFSQMDANGRNKLLVRWSAPTNTGPPINDYDVQYRHAAQLPFTGNGNAVAFAGANTYLIYTRPNANPNYQFRIKAKSPEGESTWSNWGSAFINAPPVITSAATASVAENTSTTFLTVTATDADATDTQRRYAITGGVDAAAFTLDSASGAIKFTHAPNFENPTDKASTQPTNAANNNVYLVQVTATTGQAPRLAAASQLITVTVTDATEPPGIPAAPTVAGSFVNNALTMNVTWTAPSNTGPAINDYDVRYRVAAGSTPNAWTDAGHTGTTLSTTINRVTGTTYEVQVRAKNAEGTSSWSATGTASLNSPPRFTSTTFTIPENSSRIGEITAVDDDPSDEVEYSQIVGGADRNLFEIISGSELYWKSFTDTTIPPPNYENPVDVASTTGQPTATARDNVYSIVVQAVSEGITKTRRRKANQTITITVTDAAEPPGAITGFLFSPMRTNDTRGDMFWKPPDMTGKPPIIGYDVRIRKHGTTDAWTSTALTIATPGEYFGTGKVYDSSSGYKRALLLSLIKSVTYEVQVRAKNDEGTGPWVSGTVKTNALPVVTPTSFTVPENQRSVGTFTATDSDPEDTQFSFRIIAVMGSPDGEKFTVDSQGRLQTAAASGFDYENPQSAGNSNTYLLMLDVRSDSSPPSSTRFRNLFQIISVTVTDVNETLGKPNAPTVSAVVGSNSKLDVSWTAPSNTGPAIRYYNLRYRKGTTGAFTELDATILASTTSHQLTGLQANSSYQVQVRATNGEGSGPWSDSGTGTTNASTTEPLVQNPAPRFTSAASFSVAENQTSVGTVTAVDDDAQDNVTGYTLSGADGAKFSITTGGLLTFKNTPDYETPGSTNSENIYLITVTASSGTGQRVRTANQVISVSVTDVPTPSSTAPTVTPASATSVTATWSAATTTTGYPITDYDVRHRPQTPVGAVSNRATWTNLPHTGTGRTATISSLSANINYQVQVRATNSEGIGPWSAAGTGATNAPPVVTVNRLYTVVENTAPTTTIATFTATDVDTQDGTPTIVLDGGDKSQFTLTSGQLKFKTAPNFERPADVANFSPAASEDKSEGGNNEYSLRLKATSGSGGRLQSIYSPWFKVRVTNVPSPAKPAAPTVTPDAAVPTRLTATWTAPSTTSGYPITDYDVQYRKGTSGSYTASRHIGTATTKTLQYLTGGTSYQVRVRATSSEGTSPWSNAGTGSTSSNAAPVFSSTTFSVVEGTSTVGAIVATDADASDTAIQYTIQGGADSAKFNIVENGENAGRLTFAAAPDFENPTDAAHTTPAPADAAANNIYILVIDAISGTGERASRTRERITVTVTDKNEPPVLSPVTLAPVAENTTAVATVSATDPDKTTGGLARDAITYSLSGADSGKFSITSPGGVLTFRTAPDYENPGDVESTGSATNPAANNQYIVKVTATSAAGTSRALSSQSRTLSVRVSDANEPPAAPSAPTVAAVTNYADRLDVTWTAPTNTGPPIQHYHVQYKKDGVSNFTLHSSEVAAGTTTLQLTGLTAGATYQVQVRADNAEGEGTWSASGEGTVNGEWVVLPRFVNEQTEASHSVAENTTAVTTVTATDATNAPVTFSIPATDATGGVDRAKFAITSNGVLTFRAAPNYENPQDVQSTTPANAAGNNEYIVMVQATGRGTATQTLTVTVTDVAEKPGKPAAPGVTAATATPTKLSVTWTAPTNTGPAINDYDVQYRTGGPSGTWQDAGFTGTGTSTTLTGLTQGTAYDVQVRATSDEGTGPWSASGSRSTAVNVAASFSIMTFSVAENITAVGRVTATDSDAGDNVTRYQITGGADSSKFSITETGTNRGKLAFSTAPDYEANASAASNNTYKVQIKATSGTGERVLTSAAQTFTITVTDASEPPIAPAAPTVTSVPAMPTSLSVSWTAPVNTGKPAITGYRLRYRKGSTGSFTLAAGTFTSSPANLVNLVNPARYQVQVRATNAEGNSPWSAAGSGSTATNAKPSFSSTTFSVAENTTSVGTVTATDSDASDSVTRYAITGGADETKFSITETGANKGKLVFAAAPDYEATGSAAGTNVYKVQITATSGTGARQATKAATFTITVTDVDEPPTKPAAPTVTGIPATPTRLSVTWTAPANAGKPAITGYQLQYRAGTTGSFTLITTLVTGTSTTLRGSLTQGTAYQVQVRARNAEGTGPWSAAGSGSTATNVKPSFSTTSFSLAENTTAIGTVAATDSDASDSVTRYAITGGADETKFSITETGANIGKLAFSTAPDYEANASAAGNNAYKVEVTATSGTNARQTTKAQVITVNVTNATEKPLVPTGLRVTATTLSSLTAGWSAPNNTGRPALSGYDVQYRVNPVNPANPAGAWTDVTHTGVSTSSVVSTSLTPNTSYQVRVRAENSDGTGAWTSPVTGTTSVDTAPSFTSAASFSLAENTTAVGTVAATDSDAGDSITGYQVTGGVDSAKFSITNAGALSFKAAPDYENPADKVSTTPTNAARNNVYIVQVSAAGGVGARILKTAQSITVTVTDADEPPSAPGAPTVTAVDGYADRLKVTWTAPTNTGKPPIQHYHIRYGRDGDSVTFTEKTGTADEITALTTLLTGLTAGAAYQVQVRADNAEGESTWSASGTGTTNGEWAVLPRFVGTTTTYDVAENTTAVATLVATDATNAAITYSIPATDATGGVDRAKFAITSNGALTFSTAPDYENPGDVQSPSPNTSAAGDNEYIVIVRAASSRGQQDRALIVRVTDVNEGPAFSTGSAFSVPENTTAVTTVTAADPDKNSDGTTARDSITYTKEGTDAGLFSIDSSTGVLTFTTAPNYEAPGDSESTEPANAARNNVYVLTIKATSGSYTRAMSAKLPLVITVTDKAEAPKKPNAPTVTAVNNSVTKLDVSWSAPDNTGPNITGYNVQYRKGGATGAFTQVAGDITATSTRLTGLNSNTSYDVRVRAKNAEGTSTWSDSGTGSTNDHSALLPGAGNRRPRFTTAGSFSVAENSTSVGTVEAVDDDGQDEVTRYELTGGADKTKFTITETGTNMGKLVFDAAPDYEATASTAGTNTYKVEVTATSGGTGDRRLTQAQTLTITVTDANEPPDAPTGVTVNNSTTTPMQLDVSWTAPTVPSSIPALSGYDVQYRKGTSGTWLTFSHTGTGTTAAITGLTAGASYQVQVRAKNNEGTSAWAQGSGTTAGNAQPSFSTTTFSVAENTTAIGTVTATDSDASDSVTRYAITGGADETKFSITETGANMGKLVFDAAPDYEAKGSAAGTNVYKVQITATSGTGARQATKAATFTITVTDVDEPPTKPAAPTVTGIPAEPTQLSVTWTAPSNTGKPPITGYQLQYRKGTSGNFTLAAGTFTSSPANLGNPANLVNPAHSLTQGTAYQVQVRAKNAEGNSPWSAAGSGSTAANAEVQFASTRTGSLNENSNTTANILTLDATDADTGDSISYAITGGADIGAFTIEDTNKLRFTTSPDYENPTDVQSSSPTNGAANNEYIVEVTATSGTGARASTAAQTLTITVNDVNEPPVAPAAPSVSGATLTTLKVTWTAPSNNGKPAIDDYDVQFRKSGANWQSKPHAGTGTSTTLTGLATGTTYQVQVRAKNAEGNSPWSAAGSGTTVVNSGPVFTTAAAQTIAENETEIVTLAATDADASDTITGYELAGGVDKALFEINASPSQSHRLLFKNAPNYEAPDDAASNNKYIVIVKVTSGAGARELSATRTFTVTVTDVGGEAPGKPDAPTVSDSTLSTLKVAWTAPANSGPSISDYDVQYRIGTSGSFTDASYTGTATEMTLTGLTSSTTYQVQVRAKNEEGTGPWSDTGEGTTILNNGPVFDTEEEHHVAENQLAVTVLTATDPDEGDTVNSLNVVNNGDGTLFKIDPSTNLLQFKTAPDYESPADEDRDNEYVVEVMAKSGAQEREMSGKTTVCVLVGDVGAPGEPEEPTVERVDGSGTSLSVTWTAPENLGPAIDDYDVQYRQYLEGAPGLFRDAEYEGSGTSLTLTGLKADTEYEVEVRAGSMEGYGPWSDPGKARTPPDQGENTPPRFMSQAQMSVRENTMPVGTLVAVDDEQDAIIGYQITGGVDEGAFTIKNDNELWFKKAQDYENPGDAESIEPANAANNNECLVQVMATSGEGARKRTVTQMVLVRVTDVSGPERPAAPKVSSVAGSTTKLRVKWRAPESSGLPLSDYDVQYRAEDAGAWKNAKYDGTGTTTDLTGLAAKKTYLVQVRARNSEGISPWSPDGIGSPSGPPIADAPDTDSGDPDEEGELPPDGAPAVPVIIEHKTVVINEIGNRSEDKYDWIELFNRAYEDISLKDWSLSLVDKSVVHDVARDALEAGDGSMHDVQLVHFKTDITIPARGYLLVMHSEPLAKAHPLAGGIALATPPEKPLPGQKPLTPSLPLSQCHVDAGLSLPDGDFLLILRDSATAEGTDEHLRDVAGNYYKPALVGAEPTLMWPLIAHVRVFSNFNFRSDEVWARDNTQIDGFCENAFVQAPYTGVGYDRAITPTDAGGKHSGTPGYANDALKTTAADLENPTCISISEVMFATSNALRTTENLPQWIEVFNCSESEAVSLENWRLEIRNRRNGGARPKATLIFNQALLIPPRQTVLLLSSAERGIKPRAVGRGLVSSEPWPASGHLPEAYVYSLYDEAAAQLRMTSRNDKVLSPNGFTLTLKDMADQVVDVIGNHHVEGEPVAWQLPVSKSETGARSSMLRRYVDGDAVDGRKAEAWVSAAETHLAAVQNGLYYGDTTDISTPGYRGSMLSTFEMTATGTSIELTWQTASEANTAGFYVLRCDTRDGEFMACNDSLITGAGTTSTPRTYTYTDAKKTAGVAYWYRLEEESFAGVRQVLAKRQLAFAKADVNGDGEINVQDLVFAAAGNGQPAPQAKKQNPDVNGDGIVDPRDVQAVLGVLEAKPGAAPVHPRLTANLLQPWIDKAKQLNLPDATFQRGIRELERLATALAIPKETALLPNYPNPFNPETWIPYELAEAVSVTLTFYDVRGRVVRTLALGHRPAGVYRTKARAAYWDGRNAQGERVASGVYFYTFTAGDFTATGKLAIRK